MTRSQQEIRDAVRRARADRPADEVLSGSAAITARLLDLPEVICASCVSAFASLRGEPDLWGLIRELHQRGAEVLLPRVAGPRALEWGQYDGDSSLVTGRWGILEPSPPTARDLRDATVIVVPAVAVDSRTGARIGYGGGYFDTALASLTSHANGGPLLVTPCFDDEVLVDLPSQVWDARVHVIVTPTRVIRL